MIKPLSMSLSATLLLSLAACAGPTATPGPSPSATATVTPTPAPSAEEHHTNEAEQEACEHLQEGPDAPVTATADAAGAPLVAADHKRYVITLPASGGQRSGMVRFNSPEEVEWSFIMDRDVPLIVRDAAGNSVPIVEKLKDSKFCGEVKAHYLLVLGVGPYTLEFGPTGEESIQMVVAESHPESHPEH